jgi:hypothetical protein
MHARFLEQPVKRLVSLNHPLTFTTTVLLLDCGGSCNGR